MSKYYAVKGNGEKHLFTDWDSCKEFLDEKKGYKYKSFSTKEEAEFYFSDKDYSEDLKNGFAVAFTDGSYEENLCRYSFGVIAFSSDGKTETLCDSGNNPDFVSSRNVAGEVLGVLAAVKWAFLRGYDRLKIYHDYEGLSAWATRRWQAKGAVSIFYISELKKYEGAVELFFEKVKGHSNVSYNEVVDKLAKAALFEGKVQKDEGIGCKISGTGDYESLCEYVYRQNKNIKTELGDDYCKLTSRDRTLSIYRKRGVISICGEIDFLYCFAAGYFYKNSTTSSVNRLIERFFDFNEVDGTFLRGVEITEFLDRNLPAKNYAPYIIFTLIDIEKRIGGVLKEKGFKGEKISRAFVGKDGGFKTVLPFNGAEKIEEMYSFFYRYRINLNDLIFDKSECLKFIEEAKKI